MKLGTLVHHVHGYKTKPQILILLWDLVMVFQSRKKKQGKIITKI